MGAYVIRRLLLFVPMLAAISVIAFVLIQLPPGDYLTSEIMAMAERGEEVDEAVIAALKLRYGLDRPMVEQYFRWITNIIFDGDFGRSFHWKQPVSALIWERLAWTVVIASGSLLVTWVVAFPIGIYSATHQYSIADYLFTFFGFLGKATPNFLLALVLMWLGYVYFDINMGGLFSPEFEFSPWNAAKLVDFLKHLPIPLVVIVTAGTAGLIRVLRAILLDELRKQYVLTGRAKGLGEGRLLFKYPVRIALNPIVSSNGGLLRDLLSGEVLTAIVVGLPTVGPLLLQAALAEDVYLAGSLVMVLGALALVGILISDLLLVAVDPRIRFGREPLA